MSFGTATFGLSVFGMGLEGGPIGNLGFELGTYGVALGWGVADFSTVSADWALFDNGASAYEDFETGWNVSPFYTDTSFPQIAAVFTGAAPSNIEAFELGWNNDTFLLLAMPLAQPTFTTTNLPVENFEGGWSSDEAFVTSFVDQPYLCQGYLLSDAGAIDAEEFDSWNTTGYALDLSGVSTSAASFAGLRALAVENFENVQVAQSYTAATATDQLTTTGHGLSANHRVVLATPNPGTMPSPLAPSVTYYAVTIVDANNFKLALTSGGTVIDITSTGAGLLQWSAPYENWTTLMATI